MEKVVSNKAYMIIAVLFLYVSSLAFPVFITESYQRYNHDVARSEVVYGIQVLFLGWSAILGGTIAWFANLLLPVSIILYIKESKKCYMFSIIGLLFAIYSVFYGKTWNEGDPESFVIYGLGYYLWILSFSLMLVASFYQKKTREKNDNK